MSLEIKKAQHGWVPNTYAEVPFGLFRDQFGAYVPIDFGLFGRYFHVFKVKNQIFQIFPSPGKSSLLARL